MAGLPMLILVASTIPPEPTLPPGYQLRPTISTDIPTLGPLYFDSYEPGDAAATIGEANGDIEASFAGDYGPLWLAASPVVTVDDRIVAATMVVRQASWPQAPDGPFIIEVFTDRRHRRRGLARAMLSAAMRVALPGGNGRIGLQVNDDNLAARQLYREFGFHASVPSTADIVSSKER
jgi:GNAT superfamily N-acetyltransferase